MNWKKLKLLLPFTISERVDIEIDEQAMTCRVTADTITRPSAPSGLTFTALGNGIFLDWSDNAVSEKVTNYEVFRSTNQGGPFSSLATPTNSFYTDSSASANTSYWYRVIASNDGGDSDYSEINASFASDTTPPGVPVILSTTQVGVDAVQITWTPPTDSDLAGFNVYRSTSSGGVYTKLNSSGLVTVSEYTDLGATAGTHWYYRVKSVDQTGNESSHAQTDFDVPASDTTAPSVPSSLVALDIHTAIRVSWTPNTEPDLASYSIFRSDDAYTSAIQTGLTSATYDDTSAVIGTPYTYKVLAIDTSTNSSAKSSASNSATRTSTPNAINLTPFVRSGTMAPASAHARGVRFTKYRETHNDTAKTQTITFTETNDFTALGSGNELTARYDWNFAAGTNNSPGSYATGRGFNYAHIYDTPGQYTIQLERTDENGTKLVFQSFVNIAADTRRVVYVSSDGSSSTSNSGSSQSSPVNLSRADAIISGSDDVKVVLRRGDTFDISGTVLNLKKNNLWITSQASFTKSGASSTALPKLRMKSAASSGYRYTISVQSSALNSIVEYLDFDQNFTASDATRRLDASIQVLGAGNVAIRGCKFTKCGSPIHVDESGATTRWLLVQDCVVPNNDSMIAYLTFAKGADLVYLGNKVENSQLEHPLRISQCDRICIAYNDFKNKELTSTDWSKTASNFQQGAFCYQYKNILTADIGTIGSPFAGTIQIGPLNKETAKRREFCQYCVVEENFINAMVEICDGASFVMIRNNVIRKDVSFCFQIFGRGEGTDAYGEDLSTRLNHHIYIYNNTLINQDKKGQLLRVKHAFDNFEFINNLLVAPNLTKADSGSTPTEAIYLSGLGSSNIIKRNIIPNALDQILKGSTKYATASFNQNGGTDNAVDAVTVASSGLPTFTLGKSTQARPIKGVFTSINGTQRKQSDATWTPGAWQL